MRIGIVIDSACDLPRSFIDEHKLEIMPINLRIGEEVLVDTRDPQQTIDFYKRYTSDKALDGESQPISVEQIAEMFLNRLVLEYDRVMVVCLASSRSLIFENATKASFVILKDYKRRRAEAGQEGSFGMRVVDSKALFTGEAVLVKEAIRLLTEEQIPFDKLRPTLEELSQHVHSYLVPEDLYFVRKAGRKRGDRSVGLVSYTLAKALDIKPILKAYRGDTFPVKKISGFETAVGHLFTMAQEQIKKGLLTKTICMSYAGNPETIRKMSSYKLFANYAEKQGIEIMHSVMSTTAGINVGPGAFSLAYITDKQGRD